MFGTLSEQPPSPLKMRNALGWWWHTPEDLLDKIDETNLTRDTKVFVHVIGRLLGDTVLPLDIPAHVETLRQELTDLAPKLVDRFDLAPLQSASDAVLTLALRLPGSTTAGNPARLNATLMALSRILVPIDYATTDRFSHDPALPIPDWAILQPLRDLAGTEPGSDAAYLHMVSARRAANHLAHALRSANALLEDALA
jgi:hypothetical protein